MGGLGDDLLGVGALDQPAVLPAAARTHERLSGDSAPADRY
jgi:hypothetical protein